MEYIGRHRDELAHAQHRNFRPAVLVVREQQESEAFALREFGAVEQAADRIGQVVAHGAGHVGAL